ncbi:MAG TPA: alanine--tRNA ligase-related protein [Terriglobales bacterium]|nr:alanine--tRNA ligase-related protein [Terriglobales bacterium]
MTERLYYDNSFVYDFDAKVVEVIPPCGSESRTALVLDRTAFYPTSGGQVFDTGLLGFDGCQARVIEVAEAEDGSIRHYVDELGDLKPGMQVHGSVDAERRRDHMQQHSGQHVLSAAFVRLFNMATVSFHMGDDYCSIDLDTKTLSQQQMEAVERLANDIILENRTVEIRFVSHEDARELDLRKMPSAEREHLRLISIEDFDLSACGGTHARHTGQIGCILLRKAEKVKQGMRVEFVCGQRAVRTARRDYTAVAECAGLFSCHIWDVPQQIRKSQEEAKAARRQREQLFEEVAEQHAGRMVSETEPVAGRKVLMRTFADRDLAYIKLLAQKATRIEPNIIALLGTTVQPAVVTAASQGQAIDLGALLKETLAKHGGRGGGSKDMAQGGVPSPEALERVLAEMGEKIRTI